jgi:hypothetical protein
MMMRMRAASEMYMATLYPFGSLIMRWYAP